MINYQTSIDKVLTYIDANLSEKPDLESLAQMANLSKFHFHRIMKASLNEPLGDYINRIRLATAMKLIRYSAEPIKEIAFRVGYGTPSAFGKGFRKMYGVSPTYIRKNKNLIVEQSPQSSTNDFWLQGTVKKLADIQVIFQQSKGKTGDSTTAANWASLFGRAQQHQIINSESKFYGINWDDPEITAEEKVRYDACISINSNTSVAEEFSEKTILGGRYLCFLYEGDYQNLGLVYDHIFKRWILEKEYELREQPVFEQYINNMAITPPEELLTEIFIPIK